jgi:hypothetical protein
MTNDDCSGSLCSPGPLGRTCQGINACGRPFLVSGTARVADLVVSGDWGSFELPEPATAHLTPAERHALAMHWLELARMEHASIAAFARFQLQLLSLGVGPELLDGCTRALVDETAHARLCFHFANAYSNQALGPGPLAMEGCLHATGLREVTRLVLAEGCFGETTAALEALQASSQARDPVVADALSRIAADEQRHALLAFQFLAWALRQGDAELHAEVAAFVARELARPAPPSEPSAAPDLTSHGVLSSAALHQVREHALRDVIAPCLSALLADAVAHVTHGGQSKQRLSRSTGHSTSLSHAVRRA